MVTFKSRKLADLSTEEVTQTLERSLTLIKKCSGYVLPVLGTLNELCAHVQEFQRYCPIVLALKNEKMQPHHFEELRLLTGQLLDDLNLLSFDAVGELAIASFAEEIVEISTQATQES